MKRIGMRKSLWRHMDMFQESEQKTTHTNMKQNAYNYHIVFWFFTTHFVFWSFSIYVFVWACINDYFLPHTKHKRKDFSLTHGTNLLPRLLGGFNNMISLFSCYQYNVYQVICCNTHNFNDFSPFVRLAIFYFLFQTIFIYLWFFILVSYNNSFLQRWDFHLKSLFFKQKMSCFHVI